MGASRDAWCDEQEMRQQERSTSDRAELSIFELHRIKNSAMPLENRTAALTEHEQEFHRAKWRAWYWANREAECTCYKGIQRRRPRFG
jgi:hypothetical protein